MLLQRGRAGRGTVARLFTLVALAAASAACGGSLNVPNLTATAESHEGITIEPVVITNPTLASSILADAPPRPRPPCKRRARSTPLRLRHTGPPSPARRARRPRRRNEHARSDSHAIAHATSRHYVDA